MFSISEQKSKNAYLVGGIAALGVGALFILVLALSGSQNNFVAGVINNTAQYRPTNKANILNADNTKFASGGTTSWIGSGQYPNSSYLGISFEGNRVPAGAEIVSARLEFVSSAATSAALNIEIFGDKSANPKAISQITSPAQALLTTSSQKFTDSTAWKANSVYSIDVTAPIREVVGANPATTRFNIIAMNRSNATNNRRYFFSDLNNTTTAPKLVIDYRQTVPDTTSSATTTTTARTTSTASSATTSATTTTSAAPEVPPEGSPVSKAYNVWKPTSRDTCSAEIHNKYSVVGPDGKLYPTWHPPADPQTGCTFGHEHGKDPSKSKLWDMIRANYAYDADKDGTISDSEKAKSGLPFGYANESLDAYSVNNNAGLHRHEDHVGHKVGWTDEGKPWYNNPATSGRDYMGINCSYLAKIHQGTHSKDAFTNNVHELFYFVKCDDGHEYGLTSLVTFGAPGEFNTALPCEPRGQIFRLGTDDSNSNMPGVSNKGIREILTYDCAKAKLLVPGNEFSAGLYELWSLDNFGIRTKEGVDLVSGLNLGFAVFDPIRFFHPDKANDVGYTMDLCYEVEPNGDRARGNFCTGVASGIKFDDPRSLFRDVHREIYFNVGHMNNGGGPTAWYTDPFGRNASRTPFPGSVKQYIAQRTMNYSQKFKFPIDPDAHGADDNHDPARIVHAPN